MLRAAPATAAVDDSVLLCSGTMETMILEMQCEEARKGQRRPERSVTHKDATKFSVFIGILNAYEALKRRERKQLNKKGCGILEPYQEDATLVANQTPRCRR
jgi:hypothetical protein